MSLEDDAVELKIYKNLPAMKIVSIEGFVESVSGFSKPMHVSRASILSGYEEELIINLDPKTSTENIRLIRFKGTSPVKGGNKIKAGLFLSKQLRENKTEQVVYLGILKENGSFGRIDYMSGYTPSKEDIKKLKLY